MIAFEYSLDPIEHPFGLTEEPGDRMEDSLGLTEDSFNATGYPDALSVEQLRIRGYAPEGLFSDLYQPPFTDLNQVY